MDILSTTGGAASAAFLYFLYRVGRDGVPVALAWLKAKLSAGKVAAASVTAHGRPPHVRLDGGELQNESRERR